MSARRVLAAAIAALAVALAGDPAAAVAQTPTHGLVVSATADRSAPEALEGVTLEGNAHVFVAPATGVTQVRFHLDDPDRLRAPIKVEKAGPWDFAGTAADRTALPWDTTRMANGEHTITAAIDRSSGGTLVVTARFMVRNVLPPDQVHLAWTGDPSTTLDIVWRTRETSTPSTVEYRAAGASAWSVANGAMRSSGTTGTLHEARLGALTPATAYEYRVRGDGDTWSPVHRTRTAPPPGPADFDAVYVADTGIAGRTDGLTTGTKQVIDEIAKLDPLLVLPGGDYAYYSTDKRFGTLDNTIDAWFNQMAPVATRAPMMPVYGNHEALLGEGFAPWAARFPTPPGIEERRNYSFDVGDVHFVAIFAVQEYTGLTAAALEWIEQDVLAAQSRGQRWILPYFHVSPFSDGANHPSNTALRAQLGPLFERLGIKVAIASHDQSYERSWPLVDVPKTNTPTSKALDCYGPGDGVTWVKYSPGGKLSNQNKGFSQFLHATPPAWTAVRNNTMHHFGRIRVSAAGVLRLEAYGVKGDGSPPVVQDRFEYRLGACPGRLAFTPSRVAVTAGEDGGAPADTTVRVEASGDETPAVTVTDDAAWLTATPGNASAPADITLAYDTSGLVPGVHRALVRATADGLSEARLEVTLTVPGDRAVEVSASSDRSSPSKLDGQILRGNAYIFAAADPAVSSVEFWLDDPAMAGAPRRRESNPPFDFAGGDVAVAKPFDTRTLADGTHSVTAAFVLTDGSREVATATFTVDNVADPDPDPDPEPDPEPEPDPTASHRLVSSASATREAPIVLHGATVSGDVHVFTDPVSDTRRVSFWLDDPDRSGAPRRTESNGPWDFAGGSATTALPFDTRSLADGQHVITAAVTRADSSIAVIHATFTVANGAAGALFSSRGAFG